MNTSVLCAVDVSHGEEDLPVIRRAAQLAALDGAQLDVIAVVPDFGMSSVGTFFSKDHHEQLEEEAKKQLHALITKALDADQNAKVRHVIATGRAYEEVLKLAKKIDAALIVVGAQKAELSDYLLGPNAARVVRHASCSVYVVRPS
ncbi:universal stress protein [Sulfitobacter sp. M57]|uniref:universal stress protein n=1 Tax=unclassified Sulfitobacter TaxID=196795 RepID=UPI0023E23B5D|nr:MULTISPECIES: universal stress protein [unclassified Sulfitobacter]MDF3414789.1 universal stress protein [Sulfitobacter sp. KE5]MDF3422270.1 universal stress protein [Sulfitobacter sp. KE43]MDF3433335.1 universal stress protein [Sulfitobacter sp. KE42]MDF3458975.1 universal stress protein [Sulfitobacter sp. S74]MDF3462874.1 universal stress protein [Sulfitobacter sp. Ks18]